MEQNGRWRLPAQTIAAPHVGQRGAREEAGEVGATVGS